MKDTQFNSRPLFNTDLRDKLKQTIAKKEYKGPMPNLTILGNVNRIGEEGVNHILLSKFSKNPVGKILAIDSDEPLHHRTLGYFRTFQGFWHYISTEERDDRLRELTGHNLDKLVEKLTKIRIHNFNALILDALYQRAVQKKESILLIRKSTLPFDHYRIYNHKTGLRQRMAFSFWLIEGCEVIRKAIKESSGKNIVYPDFTPFMNTPNLTLEEFIQKEFFDAVIPTTSSETAEDETQSPKKESVLLTTQETDSEELVVQAKAQSEELLNITQETDVENPVAEAEKSAETTENLHNDLEESVVEAEETSVEEVASVSELDLNDNMIHAEHAPHAHSHHHNG
jgi:hypothetical protein